MIFRRRVYDANSARNTTREHAHTLALYSSRGNTVAGGCTRTRMRFHPLPTYCVVRETPLDVCALANVVCIIQKHITRALQYNNNNIHRVNAANTHTTYPSHIYIAIYLLLCNRDIYSIIYYFDMTVGTRRTVVKGWPAPTLLRRRFADGNLIIFVNTDFYYYFFLLSSSYRFDLDIISPSERR